MKSVVWVLSVVTVFGLSTGCNKGNNHGSGGGVKAQALSEDSMIDQMSSASSITLQKDLYVPVVDDANAAGPIVTDIDVDHSKLLNCELHLPTSENQGAAHWLPVGTTFKVYKAKIGSDRSLALSIEPGDEPFDVARLSCWALKDSQEPFTISFLRDGLAGSIAIDARQ